MPLFALFKIGTNGSVNMLMTRGRSANNSDAMPQSCDFAHILDRSNVKKKNVRSSRGTTYLEASGEPVALAALGMRTFKIKSSAHIAFLRHLGRNPENFLTFAR